MKTIKPILLAAIIIVVSASFVAAPVLALIPSGGFGHGVDVASTHADSHDGGISHHAEGIGHGVGEAGHGVGDFHHGFDSHSRGFDGDRRGAGGDRVYIIGGYVGGYNAYGNYIGAAGPYDAYGHYVGYAN